MMSEDDYSSLNIHKLKERFLECGICFQEYDEDTHHPRLLPCLHSFCYGCLNKIVQANRLKCPLCMSIHEVPDNDLSNFRKDNTRRDLLDFVRVKTEPSKLTCQCCVDETQALFRCKDCSEFLCNDCCKSHHRARRTASHEVMSLKDFRCSTDDIGYFSHNNRCSSHGEVLKFFCESDLCQKPICTDCAITQHKESGGHVVRDINEVYDEVHGGMDTLKTSLAAKVKNIVQIVESIETEENMIKSETLDMKQQIIKDFEECFQKLEARKMLLLSKVQEMERGKLKQLDSQKQNLVSIQDDILQSCDVLEQSRLAKNAPAFLQIAPVISYRLEQLEGLALDSSLSAESGSKYIPVRSDGTFGKFVESFGKVDSDAVYKVTFNVECSNSSVRVNEDLVVYITLDKYNKRYFENYPLSVSVALTPTSMVEVPSFKAERDGTRYTALVTSSQIGSHTINVYINDIPVVYDTKYIDVHAEGSQENEHVIEKVETPVEDKYNDLQYEDIYSERFLSENRLIFSNANMTKTSFSNLSAIASICIQGTGKCHFDCQEEYAIKAKPKSNIFEIGFMPQTSINMNNENFQPAWSVEGSACQKCKGIGLHAKYDQYILHHYPLSNKLSSTGEKVIFKKLYGFFLDADSREIYVLDKEVACTVYQFEMVNFDIPIRPVFKICDADVANVSICLIPNEQNQH